MKDGTKIKKSTLADDSSLDEEELVEDLISIVVSFAGRIYGKRGVKNIVETIRREAEAYG